MTVFYIAFTFGFIAYLTLETIALNKAIKKIPLRILVNGTRGKSSMVQILCKAMNKSGIKTIGKITGNAPLMINPDGTHTLLKRFGPASIIENIKWLIQIARHNPDAAVLECMALQPETQAVLGQRIFKPHYTIITNIFYDHAEVMGTNLREMAKTIGLSIDQNSHVIVDSDTFGLLQNADVSLANYSKAIMESEFSADLILTNNPKSIVQSQLNLLLTLGERLPIEKERIHSAMKEYWTYNDKSAVIKLPKKNISFYNFFSVNDASSIKQLLDYQMANKPEDTKIIILFNTRDDRALRTQNISSLLNKYDQLKEFWLTGPGKWLTKRTLDKKLILYIAAGNKICRWLSEGFDTPVTIIGIGNHKGAEKILNHLRQLDDKDKKELA
ncbi:MAG: hypothetical protein JW956_10415 [Calditrichaceae bacterium]|nr:hypothetical protein [Calditrichaceae bacterium]